MTNYSTLLRNALGRRYGNYDASVKGMDKKFANNENYRREYSKTDESGSVRENVRYFNRKDGTEIAQAFCRKFNDGSGQYEILDFSSQALYDGNSVKFSQFTQGYKNGAVIEFNDTNPNGKVDENDEVRVNENGKWSLLISIKELLTGKQPVFEEEDK